jgi:hypothetical protein
VEAIMNTGEQEVLYRYIAKKALQDLRNREEIDDALLRYLNSFPLKNYCRAEIYEGDKDLLKEIASSQGKSLSLRQLALCLLREFKNDPDVKNYLYTLWKISSEYELKIEVLWSLLSYSDLSEELHNDIRRNFIASDWDKWLPLIVEKLGGDEKEKTQVKELIRRYFNL